MKKTVTTIATAAILSSAFATSAFADTYTVKKGDTLSHIARNHSISVNKLKSLNGLNSDLIFPNQKLTVSKTSQTGNTTAKPATQPTGTTTSTKTSTYKIVSGDTLSGIAQKHKISLANLKSWNKLTSDLIYPGQKLIVSKTTASAPSAGSTPTTPAPTVPAPTPAVASESVYTIKSGDTLGKIASQFNMTVTALKSLNNLSSDLIYAGKTLKVSGQATPTETTEDKKTEAPAATNGDKVVQEAKALLGTPYVWGGSTTKGFDCSGFIYYVYNKTGKNLTRTSAEGYYNRSYYVDKPQVGDLVFFENTYKKGISHVGIYLGNNEFIHAGNDKVEISSLNNSYYKKHFESFKRFY
jgi:LysM repeat protein